MDYYIGGSFRSIIDHNKKKEKHISEAKIQYWLGQVIHGINYLHQQKVVHRDIKPENFMIDANGHVKIIDFGLAKELKGTHMSTKCGTKYYESPEMLDGKPYGQEIDIWGIGCVFYELCTLNPPFYHSSEREYIKNICENNPDPIEKYSDSLTNLIYKMLMKDPNQRITAAQLSEVKMIDCPLFHHWRGVNDMPPLDKHNSII